MRRRDENETQHHVFAALALAACLVAACDASTTDPDGPAERTLTVDASADWVYVDLDETAQVVSVADPATSEAWDIAFFATSVMLNGGAAGPGGVSGTCLCQNEDATAAQVMAFTAEAELVDFESVTATSVPASAEFVEDELDPALTEWYSYNPVTHVVTPNPARVWKFRTAEGDAYAKVHIVGIADAAQTHAGRVTVEYALQPSAGAAFGAVRQVTVDASTGPVGIDLESGAASSAAGWDIRVDGWNLLVNGGTSGPGQAGAVVVEEAFEAITDASDLTASHYSGDAFGGVFVESPWYRYNLTGQDHHIWPTFDVYVVKRGDEVYKVQIINYYDVAAKPRQITFRHERLD
jgi:HmuY protein